jgi:hypothetical protein
MNFIRCFWVKIYRYTYSSSLDDITVFSTSWTTNCKSLLNLLVMMDWQPYLPHGNCHGKECHGGSLKKGTASNLVGLQMDWNIMGSNEVKRTWDHIDVVENHRHIGLETMLLCVCILRIWALEWVVYQIRKIRWEKVLHCSYVWVWIFAYVNFYVCI